MTDRHRQVVVRVNLGTHFYMVAGVSLAIVAASQTTPVLKGLRQGLRKLGQVIRHHSPAPASHDLENAGTVQFRGPTGDDTTGTQPTTVEALDRLPQEGRMLLDISPVHEDYTGQGPVVNDNETEEGTRLEFVAQDSANQAKEEREEGEEKWEWEARQWEEWEEEWEEEGRRGGRWRRGGGGGYDGRGRDGDYGGYGAYGGRGGESEERREWEERQEWERREWEERQDWERRDREEEWDREAREREEGWETEDEREGPRYGGNRGDYVDDRDFEEILRRMREDGYAGNPGDYVNERGFQRVLQESFDNDNPPRGAQPAAKAAVDCLPLIPIEERHLDNGSAACTICQDIVALGESAKQMPCSHLYHNDCILPWLKTHNACPVCRYELPTDDQEHEEQSPNFPQEIPTE